MKGMDVGDSGEGHRRHYHGAVELHAWCTGPDAAKFKIDQKTGQITTMVDLNRECDSSRCCA